MAVTENRPDNGRSTILLANTIRVLLKTMESLSLPLVNMDTHIVVVTLVFIAIILLQTALITTLPLEHWRACKHKDPSDAVGVRSLTCLARGAMADEGGHSVLTGGARTAGSRGAVVNVLRAVQAAPTVDTYAVVAARDVVARAAILAGVGLQMALIHIVCAVLTCSEEEEEEEGRKNG